MEDIELKALWQAYDQKLERSLALNLHLVKELQTQKVRSALRSLTWYKVLLIVLGLLWTGILGWLMYRLSGPQLISFTISAGMVVLFNLVGIVSYIRHLVLIHRIDNSDSVLATQKHLAELQASTLRVMRILYLQMPFYTTFLYTPAMFVHGGLWFWLSTVPVTLAFTAASIWLYRNIRLENSHKKWFRRMFDGPEWRPVTRAIAFLEEIDAFEREDAIKK
ncbi:hypothetical protein [Chitinophaga japonensis]|uniref:Uncharacterized protein n=1 Tax=Chitinophaga japonensis TaxID=104662 RepID=A0A562SS94_CHIJA|nr:hypothetical protein [Chitinophaga japonensis]TWI84003.1 hypothetical protein LX66_4364 [Chitinophaga japonensis]